MISPDQPGRAPESSPPMGIPLGSTLSPEIDTPSDLNKHIPAPGKPQHRAPRPSPLPKRPVATPQDSESSPSNTNPSHGLTLKDIKKGLGEAIEEAEKTGVDSV